MAKAVAAKRSDERYELVGNQFVTVSIEADDHRREPITVAAQLLNLSSSGAKLSVPLDLPRDKLIQIKLMLEEFGLTMYVSGTVCWTAKDGEQSCLVGCKLKPNIPTSVLQHIAQSGRLDRRDEDRRPVKCSIAIVRRRLLRNQEEPGELLNYAIGGVCLARSQPSELGERLTVQLDKSTKIDVLVRWQLQQGGECLIGCEYVDAGSFETVKAALGK
jgi:hypothetical protein